MSTLAPTTPIEELPGGGLAYEIYDQTGQRVRMTCADTPDNRRFIVWLRQHDRYTPAPATPGDPT